MGLAWHPTRPPVAMDRWRSRGSGRAWTTVMTWNNFLKPVEYQGRVFGTKEMEFSKIETAPKVLPEIKFEIAKGGADAPVSRWQGAGWSVIDSHSISTTPDDYRRYIETSRGELSVAKNLYVATRSGWFSCRSACYLAAGRPVVVQDTGFPEVIPIGTGLFAFSDGAQAAAAIAQVESDYQRHSLAASALAAEYFDGRSVVGSMLQRIGLL
jgi:glycosyltransferase involved in cell wall biosynthesis